MFLNEICNATRIDDTRVGEMEFIFSSFFVTLPRTKDAVNCLLPKSVCFCFFTGSDRLAWTSTLSFHFTDEVD